MARRYASWVIAALGLNRQGFLSTEIVQQIRPICTTPTRSGPLRCVAGHGRLRWRALTFYTEEPQTITWLDSLKEHDLLWDVGANVGLYAIYAAKVARCKVVAFEPEAQNYALLLENIVLNGVQALVDATNLPVTRQTGFGRLHVHALTKGGAYNQFELSGSAASGGDGDRLPSSIPVTQVQLGVSLDDLITTFQFPCPTHIKVDVDGNEPDIIAGAQRVLAHPRCRSVLVEVRQDDAAHQRIIKVLQGLGYRCVSQQNNWDFRANREREHQHPALNMIFTKGAGHEERDCAAVSGQGISNGEASH